MASEAVMVETKPKWPPDSAQSLEDQFNQLRLEDSRNTDSSSCASNNIKLQSPAIKNAKELEELVKPPKKETFPTQRGLDDVDGYFDRGPGGPSHTSSAGGIPTHQPPPPYPWQQSSSRGAYNQENYGDESRNYYHQHQHHHQHHHPQTQQFQLQSTPQFSQIPSQVPTSTTQFVSGYPQITNSSFSGTNQNFSSFIPPNLTEEEALDIVLALSQEEYRKEYPSSNDDLTNSQPVLGHQHIPQQFGPSEGISHSDQTVLGASHPAPASTGGHSNFEHSDLETDGAPELKPFTSFSRAEPAPSGKRRKNEEKPYCEPQNKSPKSGPEKSPKRGDEATDSCPVEILLEDYLDSFPPSPLSDCGDDVPNERKDLIAHHLVYVDKEDFKKFCENHEADVREHINKQNILLQSPLYTAVKTGNMYAVEQFIEFGADPSIQGREEKSEVVQAPLHKAVELDNPHLVAILLEKCPNINIEQQRLCDRKTPLMLALHRHSCHNNELREQRLIIIRLLVEKGADVYAMVEQSDKTIFMMVIETGDIPLVKYILQYVTVSESRDLINRPNRAGNTSFHIAAGLQKLNKEDHLELLKILLYYGGNTDAQNQDNKTPKDWKKSLFDEMNRSAPYQPDDD